MAIKAPALHPDFLDFIVCLGTHDVKFVLVGAHALGVHGVVRATGDIDFPYEPTPTNVEALCSALGDFGAPPRLIDPLFLLSPEAVTQIGVPPSRIDLMSAISGVTYAAVEAGSARVTVGGQTIRVIGLNELRLNKASTGRAKDAEDLRRLKRQGASSKRPGKAGRRRKA